MKLISEHLFLSSSQGTFLPFLQLLVQMSHPQSDPQEYQNNASPKHFPHCVQGFPTALIITYLSIASLLASSPARMQAPGRFGLFYPSLFPRVCNSGT